MKSLTLVVMLALVLVGSLPMTSVVAAGPEASGSEYAIVRWDGPDRLHFNLPDKYELVFLGKDRGVKLPKGCQPEAFCLSWAANAMAKEGWEVVNLNSRRILLRRDKK